MISPILGNTLRVAGPAFFLAIQGCSVQTALSIKENESTGKLSPIPFLSLLTNCAVWTMYGLKTKDKTILVPNALGVFTGALCTGLFHSYAFEKPLVLYSLSAAVVLFCLTQGTTTIGSVGCILAVMTCGSPLPLIARFYCSLALLSFSPLSVHRALSIFLSRRPLSIVSNASYGWIWLYSCTMLAYSVRFNRDRKLEARCTLLTTLGATSGVE